MQACVLDPVEKPPGATLLRGGNVAAAAGWRKSVHKTVAQTRPCDTSRADTNRHEHAGVRVFAQFDTLLPQRPVARAARRHAPTELGAEAKVSDQANSTGSGVLTFTTMAV